MSEFLVVHGRNPLKTAAAAVSAEIWLPGRQVHGSDLTSAGPAQPKGLPDIMDCAEHRARAVLVHDRHAAIGLGIESGVVEWGGKLLTMAAVYLEDRIGKTGKALTPGVELPDAVSEMVMEGLEVSEALGRVQGAGVGRDCVGAVTGGYLPAVRFFSGAVDLAMIAYRR